MGNLITTRLIAWRPFNSHFFCSLNFFTRVQTRELEPAKRQKTPTKVFLAKKIVSSPSHIHFLTTTSIAYMTCGYKNKLFPFYSEIFTHLKCKAGTRKFPRVAIFLFRVSSTAKNSFPSEIKKKKWNGTFFCSRHLEFSFNLQ